MKDDWFINNLAKIYIYVWIYENRVKFKAKLSHLPASDSRPASHAPKPSSQPDTSKVGEKAVCWQTACGWLSEKACVVIYFSFELNYHTCA